MRQLFIAILFIGNCLLAKADHHENTNEIISISGHVNLDDQYSVFFTWKGPGGLHSGTSKEVSIDKNGYFNWQAKIDAPQFVIVSIQTKSRNRQLPTIFPLYLVPGKEISMNLNYSDSTYLTYLSGNLDNNNQALIAYSRLSVIKEIRLFRNADDDNLNAIIATYISEADSLMNSLNVQNATVKKYMEIWSFNNYQEALFRYSMRADDKPGKYRKVSLPKSPVQVYDNDIALLFPSTPRFINRYLVSQMDSTVDYSGLNEVKERIELLRKYFTNHAVIQWVAESNLKEAIRRYRVKDNNEFEKEEKLFVEIAGNITNVDTREGLINDFKNLRYTQPGASAPAIVFENLKGKKVQLTNFKGKYIYIDLWASWCIPCIKEIPNLQKLEKDFKKKNIVFVSISIDADATAWKKKAKALKLKGHQLHIGDSDFAAMMNISAIPHFLLYDPEGKLVMYNAPRPGAGEIRTFFDSL